ncbi:MAG: response regulator transcription factor [Deltaproteobacteria bacterium]|nr:response regulator transcription factor [Deltaproteobacteria bacterium]
MPELKEKKASAAKEPVEIKCSECDTSFRLWIPSEQLSEWERGSRISCVKCGSQFFLKWTGAAFDVNPLSELAKKAAQKAAEIASRESAPRKAAPAPPPAAPPATPQVKAEPVRETSAPAREAAHEAGAETILVIEDDRLSRDMVEKTLSEIGFSIIPAKSSTEAMKAAKGKIHLIVTDLYLKNPADAGSALDGEELLVQLRESGVSAPAIITTGKDIIDDLVLDPKWFELNVKGFIQKGNPFWVEELKLKVKEVLYKG